LAPQKSEIFVGFPVLSSKGLLILKFREGDMLKLTFEQEMKLYNTITYTGLAIITVWILLKMFGIINTPIILIYLPYLIGILTIFTHMHGIAKSFWALQHDVAYLKDHAVKTDQKFEKIDQRLDSIEKKLKL